MVWAGSTRLGCGVKHCPKNGTTLYVCNYKPPGNYRGQKPYTAGTKKDCLTSTTVNGPKQKRSTTSGSGNLWQTRKTTAAKLISFLLILLLSNAAALFLLFIDMQSRKFVDGGTRGL
ncbi:hypothetical protein X801_05448 [Opisthorchis viverrini]|uniref:SCP domain-containing protein n=1 Tax=Opisthorchis viverrini TaxID=6198 RepID=A0A1S8WWF1_OPIVI|nr:hypothetical protein X801_05448 [Opisthorchis viverrini]